MQLYVLLINVWLPLILPKMIYVQSKRALWQPPVESQKTFLQLEDVNNFMRPFWTFSKCICKNTSERQLHMNSHPNNNNTIK